ncbi:Copia protein, partial [Mucuna pruriens]
MRAKVRDEKLQIKMRTRQPPERFEDYTSIPNFEVIEEGDMMHLVLLAEIESMSFEQAIREPEWKVVMKEELRAIKKNRMWELVKPTREVAKYKVRLVAKEFLQKAGLDYNKVFAHVAKIETIRLVVATAIFRGWSLHQLDVKPAFLNKPPEEEVYVCQPPSFEVIGHENKVYKLKKLDFNKCIEYGVYVRATTGDLMFICLYVDDLLVTRSNTTYIDEFKRRIILKFEMTNLGLLSYFLGMEFVTTSEEVSYAELYSAQTPIDCGINSRPDIAYGVRLISSFMDHLRISHLLVAKRILRFVKGTLDYELLFSKHARSVYDEIYGYCDFDWCSDKSDRKNTTGYCSKKQSVVVLSSCEAEYIAPSIGVCQALWLKNLIVEMKIRGEEPMKILIDIKLAISLAKHHVANGRISNGKLELKYCSTNEQVTNILTKPLKVSTSKIDTSSREAVASRCPTLG